MTTMPNACRRCLSDPATQNGLCITCNSSTPNPRRAYTPVNSVSNLSVDDVARLVRDLTPAQKARVVHVHHAAYDTYIGRRCGTLAASKWCNIFRLDRDSERRHVLRQYTDHLLAATPLLADLHELRGKTLGCWCRKPGHDVLCHGLVLVALADRLAPPHYYDRCASCDKLTVDCLCSEGRCIECEALYLDCTCIP